AGSQVAPVPAESQTPDCGRVPAEDANRLAAEALEVVPLKPPGVLVLRPGGPEFVQQVEDPQGVAVLPGLLGQPQGGDVQVQPGLVALPLGTLALPPCLLRLFLGPESGRGLPLPCLGQQGPPPGAERVLREPALQVGGQGGRSRVALLRAQRKGL